MKLIAVLRSSNSHNLVANLKPIQEEFNVKDQQLVLNHLLIVVAMTPRKGIREKQVMILKEAGADFTYKEDVAFHNTALLWAIANGYNKMAQLLIKHGAKAVNIIAKNSMSPLTLAIAKGYLQKDSQGIAVTPINRVLAQELVEAGANVNHCGREGHTPLHSAVLQRDRELIQYLLQKGADRTIKNDRGETPFDLLKLTMKETHNRLSELCSQFHEQNIPTNEDDAIARLLSNS